MLICQARATDVTRVVNPFKSVFQGLLHRTEFHVWYYNKGQKTTAEEFVGPRTVPDFVLLLNCHTASVPYKYLYLASDLATSTQPGSQMLLSTKGSVKSQIMEQKDEEPT